MSDGRTLEPREPQEELERLLSLERHGRREVVRIPLSDWENKPSLRGELIKGRFDNEQQEWMMEVFTDDEDGSLERPSCITDWEEHSTVSFLRCTPVMCNECAGKIGWDSHGNIVVICYCHK
jgi:hypothetical protein